MEELNDNYIQQGLYNFTEYLNYSSVEIKSESLEITKAVSLGTTTGLLIVFFMNVIFSVEYDKLGYPTLKVKIYEVNTKTFSRIVALVICLLILPIISLLLLLASVYKLLCSVVIMKKDKHFVKFLDSFDVFWSLEDDASKSIINVLGVIESESPQAVMEDIKVKLLGVFSEHRSEKLFYRRNEEYGFYYWQRHCSIDINQYVELVELPDKPEELSVEDLEDIMTELSNQMLPYKNEGLFKILITNQRIGNYDEKRGDYGIIFRIHHSVGDGVALIDFLCKTLADTTENTVNMFSMPDVYDQSSPKNILDMICKLIEVPISFVDMILRKPDENSLHGPNLSGKKLYKWTESDENLLVMVKEIKNNVDQFKFSDILANALSNGLYNYFTKTMAHIPDDVAVIIPIRLTKSLITEGEDVKLANDFNVTILDLPIMKTDNKTECIKNRCVYLRRSIEPKINHYFLKFVCNVLPRQPLQSLLYSNHASIIFSSLPGPECLNICGGNLLKSLLFFVPLKGNTGVCVTGLSYGGVLRFAICADAAVIPDSKQLSLILDGMVDEIKRLHQLYTLH